MRRERSEAAASVPVSQHGVPKSTRGVPVVGDLSDSSSLHVSDDLSSSEASPTCEKLQKANGFAKELPETHKETLPTVTTTLGFTGPSGENPPTNKIHSPPSEELKSSQDRSTQANIVERETTPAAKTPSFVR